MSIHNAAFFPDPISYGFSAASRFRTSVLVDFAGNEQRNQEWNQARLVFTGEEALKDKTHFEALKAFFMARRGRAFGFRFRDWFDYKAVNEPVVRLDGLGNPIVSGGDLVSTGNGSATVFQLYKKYASGGKNFFREITRPRAPADYTASEIDPVAQAFQIRINSVVQTETTHYTINRSTGRVTFVSPPGNGLAVDWSGTFDVPCRFGTDELETSFEDFDSRVTPFDIVEIRNEEDA